MDSGLTGTYAVALSGDGAPKAQFDSQVHKGESAGRPPVAPFSGAGTPPPTVGNVGTVGVSEGGPGSGRHPGGGSKSEWYKHPHGGITSRHGDTKQLSPADAHAMAVDVLSKGAQKLYPNDLKNQMSHVQGRLKSLGMQKDGNKYNIEKLHQDISKKLSGK
jgi:hypothetical protein